MLNGRVFLIGGGDAAARAAVDWMVAHQSGCEVVVAGRGPGARPIGRLAHPPFRPPAPGALEVAARVAAVLRAARPSPPDAAGAPPDAAGGPPSIEAAVLAIAACAPLMVAGGRLFGDLVGLSAWSMNVPSRPTDVLMARHAAIAERAWSRLGPELAAAPAAAAGAPLIAALLAGETARVEAAARARRRAARADGPIRFRRIAARSAGLRPFAIYLDLLPALAAAGEPARALLRDLGPERSADLLGMAIALFL